MLRVRDTATMAAILAVVLFTGCVPLVAGGRKSIPTSLTFLISSNTVSNFTPCGCHSGKWGGMPRRGTIFESIKNEIASKPQPWPVLIVDTGDISQGSTTDIQKKKDDYIFQAYAVIGYDAVNVGMSDLRLGLDQLKEYETNQGIPWVSCNTYAEGTFGDLPPDQPPEGSSVPAQIPSSPPPGSTLVPPPDSSGNAPSPTSPVPPSSGNAQATQPAGASDSQTGAGESTSASPKPGEPLFAPYRVVEKPEAPGFKIGIIGAMVQDNPRLNAVTGYSFEPFNAAIKKSIDALRQREKADIIVLLCDSDANNLDQLLSQEVKQGLDLVIGGRMRPQPSPNAGSNPLNPQYTGNAGRQSQVPGAGTTPTTVEGSPGETQNQQAGEETEQSQSAAIDALEPVQTPLIIPKAQARGRLVTRLTLTLNSSGKIVDYWFEEIQVSEQYEDDRRMEAIAQGYDRDVLAEELNTRVRAQYAGSEACYRCHPGFRAVWENERHFRSYETISAENKLGDRSCTRCHAIGYVEEPRLLTYDLIPETHRQVGCEGCHPNGQRHITLQNQLATMTPEQRANATITDPITNPVEGATCLECHTGEWGQGFDPAAAIAAAKQKCESVQNPTVEPDSEETSD